MHTLVWTENSLDSISLHLVQEYVIRWHRYKIENSSHKYCRQYIKDCRVHLCHLPDLGHIGHSPKGDQWECWDPGLGSNVVGPPVLPPPTMWPTQSQGDICANGWLAEGYLTKGQPDPPLKQRHLVAKCVTTFGQVNLWSDVPPGQRYLVAKCHTISHVGQVDFGQMYPPPPQPETSCGKMWCYLRSGLPVYLRVSLVPAAMVIPPPIAYIKVVAVKKIIFMCWRWIHYKSYVSSYHPMQNA